MATKVTRKPGPGLAVLKALGEMDGQQSRVGWFKTSKYPDGTPVAYVAAIQEFGYAPKNIPPRMGLRQLLRTKTSEYRALCGNLAKAIIKGASVYDMLEALGAKVAGDFRKQISDVTEPPLKPETIAARARHTASGEVTKGLSKPLIDTGYMQASISHVTGKASELGELSE